MDLETEIAAYDGKHKDVLEAIAARLPPGGGAVRDLTALARRDDAKLQAGATWLLKHFQEKGLAFSAQQSGALLALLGEVSHWEARLHLLQILPALTLPEERKAALYRLLTGSNYLQAPNKFVRAWTYNALAILATRFPELRGKVALLLISAQEDEAASVRARLRSVMKAHTWVETTGSGKA